ncbi:MAG: Gfo/Idh/MocA family oxidoreductase [Bacteroidota bacterium]|nr:Gfo/Idh/MocA family oxidoreductase [Bacteroidota bacterium]
MMQALINKYKKIRKAGFINKAFTEKYAFVGIGNHSLNNLYPVLNYLNVDIKYIVSHSEDTAKLIQANFEHINGTTNYDAVLNDSEIKGIFISASPSAHFELISKALKKNKNVFVEKPPCFTSKELSQLIELEKQSKGFVLTGLQKRYAPLYQILKTKTKKAESYSLRYETGYYPEGNALTDLFIHPIDITSFLFGNSELISVLHRNSGKGIESLFIQLKHSNGTIGNIELSTNTWWASAEDTLRVNCKNAHYHCTNTEKLVKISKAGKIAGIPSEKIKNSFPISKVLFEKNAFLPVMQHNDLYSAGYYNEIRQFLELCEGKKGENNSELSMLTNTFQHLDNIKKQMHV